MGLDSQHLAQLEQSLHVQRKNGAATTAPNSSVVVAENGADVGASAATSSPNGNKGPDVYRAIAEVATGISRGGIAKGRRNEQQGYSFRGIDDLYNGLSALLATAGLVILPRMLSRSQEERMSGNNKPLFFVVVQADFDFVSARDGSKHTVTMFGEAMDSADKATNKAMSAAYKYAAMQTFCIPTESMDDADQHTPEPMPKSAPKPAPVPQPAVPQKPVAAQPVAAPAATKTWASVGQEKQAFWGFRHKLGSVQVAEEFKAWGFDNMSHLFEQSGVKRLEFYNHLEALVRQGVQ